MSHDHSHTIQCNIHGDFKGIPVAFIIPEKNVADCYCPLCLNDFLKQHLHAKVTIQCPD